MYKIGQICAVKLWQIESTWSATKSQERQQQFSTNTNSKNSKCFIDVAGPDRNTRITRFESIWYFQEVILKIYVFWTLLTHIYLRCKLAWHRTGMLLTQREQFVEICFAKTIQRIQVSCKMWKIYTKRVQTWSCQEVFVLKRKRNKEKEMWGILQRRDNLLLKLVGQNRWDVCICFGASDQTSSLPRKNSFEMDVGSTVLA